MAERDPMLPEPYRVASKRQELGDVWTLGLEPAQGADRIGLRPGQFAMLYAFGAGEVPISVSRVGTDGSLVYTIRAVGDTTRALCGSEPGDQLGVRGPFGTVWPLADAEGGDVVAVAGGVGLAPLRPAVEHLVANRDRYGEVALLYGSRTPREMLYAEDLTAWSKAGIEVLTTVDCARPGYHGRVGLVTTLIEPARFDPATATAMVCGPEVMMRFVAAGLAERGVAKERIHVSLERNMKCAIGHCGHCQLAHKFICKDGAVFPLPVVESLMAVREL